MKINRKVSAYLYERRAAALRMRDLLTKDLQLLTARGDDTSVVGQRAAVIDGKINLLDELIDKLTVG
jgi:hypothetical protein